MAYWDCYQLINVEWYFRYSLDRMEIEQIGIGQLHWSTANYAPLQERALWDGLVAMYDKVTMNLFFLIPLIYQENK